MSVLRDSPISFPGLFGDWAFTASSVMLPIGHGIYWYGFILAAGLLAGLWFCMKQAKHYGLTEDNVIDMILWAVPLCIVGSRIYYIVFYYDLFRTATGGPDWGKMIAIWDGGLAIYGTVIVGFLVAYVYCKRKKLKLGAMSDLCVMGLLIGQSIGRWGNFMNREAFGTSTTLPWRMRLWTSATEYIEVHPTFLYESLWNLVGLLLLYFVVSKARRFDGESTWFYFLWYGLGRLWVEGLRTDSLYLFDWTLFGAPIRVSQLLSGVMVAVAACMLVYHLKVKPHPPGELLVDQVAARALEQLPEEEPATATAPEEPVTPETTDDTVPEKED
ncbi:MAG: prolipoprotein diacylglyceryl transferase [Oscillospiraceae bacterium]